MYHGCHKSIETTPSPTFFLLGLGIKKEIVVRKGPPSKQPGGSRSKDRARDPPTRLGLPKLTKRTNKRGPPPKTAKYA